MNMKASQNQTLQEKSHQRNWHLGCNPFVRYLGTILEIDKGRISTNGPEDKNANDNELGLTFERWHGQTIYVKKRKTT